MNIMEEEKQVTINPLPEVPAQEPKPKRGRPRKHPVKVKIETHVTTPARRMVLEKARVKKRELAAERKAAAAVAAAQTNLTAPAQQTQGYSYGPQFDLNAAAAQSYQHYVQPPSYPMQYYAPNTQYLEQAEKITKVESLLNQLLSAQMNPNIVPQNVATEDPARAEMNKHSIHNQNPYLSRRFGR